MKATVITLLRILLVFVIAVLFGHGFAFDAIATLLIVCVIAMDGLDGYIARRYGETSKQGAVLDILGDRIVENVLWIYFACVGEYSFWIPIIVITRAAVVDNIRSLALAQGLTAFGETTMQKEGWARFLVSSNWSRGLYALAKCVCFAYIGLMVTIGNANVSVAWIDYMITIKFVLIYGTVAMCLLRGLPVIWEGRRYIFENRLKETS
ncbi:MAG: CDP-alcohol phosphatidyltransferase family protein [Candidatus Brocadiales bacterium]|nr:CDP-alcohol phosphatidyltransferase family protein [Candidatus Bathyanammoxibius amoris]